MFHHGVWLNLSRQDATAAALPERFFAVGEEKTILTLPRGLRLSAIGDATAGC